MLDHTGELPYKCDHCPRKFKTFHLRKRHMDSKHLNLRPFTCEECSKTFSTMNDLKRHLGTKVHKENLIGDCI